MKQQCLYLPIETGGGGLMYVWGLPINNVGIMKTVRDILNPTFDEKNN